MTIEFNCPNCEALIAFDSKHCGKRARCLTCGQILIIPSKSLEKAQKIEPVIEKSYPVPGFWQALFIESWKIFFRRENATSLVFVAAVVVFGFFLGRGICCVGAISFIICWGWLLGFYLNIIYETAFGIDELPEIYLGTSFTLMWYIVKPFLVFCFTMLVVQLPFIIALAAVRDKGITYRNMWQAQSGLNLLLQGFFVFGLFLFPVAVLTITIGRDLSLLRPDYLLKPIFKASGPYIMTVALLVAACLLETQANQYDWTTKISIHVHAGQLALNLVVQLVAIIAMRAIGLFYRHYSCHMQW